MVAIGPRPAAGLATAGDPTIGASTAVAVPRDNSLDYVGPPNKLGRDEAEYEKGGGREGNSASGRQPLTDRTMSTVALIRGL